MPIPQEYTPDVIRTPRDGVSDPIRKISYPMLKKTTASYSSRLYFLMQICHVQGNTMLLHGCEVIGNHSYSVGLAASRARQERMHLRCQQMNWGEGVGIPCVALRVTFSVSTLRSSSMTSNKSMTAARMWSWASSVENERLIICFREEGTWKKKNMRKMAWE